MLKSSRSVIETRRQKILNYLEKHGSVSVDFLAKEFNISNLTIRRDLEQLSAQGLVERYFGGAYFSEKNPNIENTAATSLLQKHAIAKRAADFVSDGDTIFINTSSTSLLMLKYITAKLVTVITNNGKAIFCDTMENILIVLTGGELRSPKEAMVGEFAINTIMNVTANKCFLGCSGLSSAQGMTTAVLPESAINRLMLTRVTGKRFVLADRSKIGLVGNFVSGTLGDIDTLITDDAADENELKRIEQNNVEIIKVRGVL